MSGNRKTPHFLTQMQRHHLFTWFDNNKKVVETTSDDVLIKRLTTELGFPILRSHLYNARYEYGIKRVSLPPKGSDPNRLDRLEVRVHALYDMLSDMLTDDDKSEAVLAMRKAFEDE